MEEKITTPTDTIIKILSGILGSIIVGYLFFHEKIFNFHNVAFAFITCGIFGAAFFSLIPKFDLKKQILLFAAVFIINIIIMGKPYRITYMLKYCVLILTIFLSIKAYIFFLRKNKSFPLFLRAFALPVIYALINVAGIMLLFLLSLMIEGNNISYLPRILLINAELAGLVGIGLGLGFDLWEFIKKKILKMQLHSQPQI